MLEGTDKAGVDERYTVATHATDLKVVAHHGGAVDVLAAAAWSPSRIGSALLRLHSEFDGGERLRKGPSFETDAKLLMMRLKTMPAVREQLTLQAMKWQMEDAGPKAAQVLLWWLDRNCPKCHGRRFQSIPGTPALSSKPCPPRQAGGCGGSGEQRTPGGQDGRKLANFLEDCISRARQSIRQRLRSQK